MTDRKFIGNCKPGKFDNQTEIGLQSKDIETLREHLNDRGWVNLRVSKNKEGKPYCEIILPKS